MFCRYFLPDVAWPAARSAALWAFCPVYILPRIYLPRIYFGLNMRQGILLFDIFYGIVDLQQYFDMLRPLSPDAELSRSIELANQGVCCYCSIIVYRLIHLLELKCDLSTDNDALRRFYSYVLNVNKQGADLHNDCLNCGVVHCSIFNSFSCLMLRPKYILYILGRLPLRQARQRLAKFFMLDRDSSD